MGTIKDRNGKYLREEEIKKRWQEYTKIEENKRMRKTRDQDCWEKYQAQICK